MIITHIHISDRFEKMAGELERSTGEGEKVVWQARDLIARMKNGEDPAELPRQTRHGEQRIQNCRKFALKGGYRMVTIQAGTRLYLECIGSHDQCHQWLENNRGFVPAPTAGHRIVPVRPMEPPACTSRREPLEDEYEQGLMSRIDEKTLRMIFSGICCQQT